MYPRTPTTSLTLPSRTAVEPFGSSLPSIYRNSEEFWKEFLVCHPTGGLCLTLAAICRPHRFCYHFELIYSSGDFTVIATLYLIAVTRNHLMVALKPFVKNVRDGTETIDPLALIVGPTRLLGAVRPLDHALYDICSSHDGSCSCNQTERKDANSFRQIFAC